LLKKGHKTREIAKMANVSNTTIKKIRQETTKNASEEKNEQRINHCPSHPKPSSYF
jgi:transposase